MFGKMRLFSAPGFDNALIGYLDESKSLSYLCYLFSFCCSIILLQVTESLSNLVEEGVNLKFMDLSPFGIIGQVRILS